MDKARYVVALLLVAALPPGILLWLVVHPFASFWRRLGSAWAYAAMAGVTAACMAPVFVYRRALFAVEFGTSVPAVVGAAFCLTAGIFIALKRKRHLTKRILIGVPEISAKAYPGELLTKGPYAVIRHPRYVEVLLISMAYALFANYLAGYVVMALALPALHLVVLVEERELRQRFGPAYQAYQNDVPRYLPRTARSGRTSRTVS